MDDSSYALLIEQFKAVTDISTDENDANITNLLRVHDYNVNNAISTYFDSGFTSVAGNHVSSSLSNPESNTSSSAASEYSPADDVLLPSSSSGVASSGAAVHDLEDNSSRHRSTRRTSFQTVNLQHQLYYDSFMPKLPRAPKLSNHWQLAFSLHTSRKAAELREKEHQESNVEKKESDDILVHEETKATEVDSDSESKNSNGTRKSRPLWILLLIIPQGILNALLSIAQFLLSPFFSTSSVSSKRRALPKLFDYDHLQMDYIPRLSPAASEIAKNKLHVVDKHFNETFDKSMKEYKWLLVILLASENETHEENEPSFVSKFLTQGRLSTVFTKDNSSVFVGNIDGSPECLELAQTYQVKKLPYIMLCANINNIPSIAYKCNLAPVFVTPEAIATTIDKVVRNLLKQVDIYTPQLISDRFESQEMEQSRQIRQSQDDAYLQSLERDRQRKLEKENIQWLASIKSLFLKYQLALETEIGSDEAPVRFAIKLPTGKRLVSKFPLSWTVSQLYLHIEKQLFVAQLIEGGDFTTEEAVYESLALERPAVPTHKNGAEFTLEDYSANFPWKFEVVQPFPKVVIGASLKRLSEVSELKGGANLLVEYTDENNEDDDDDDEEHNA